VALPCNRWLLELTAQALSCEMAATAERVALAAGVGLLTRFHAAAFHDKISVSVGPSPSPGKLVAISVA